MTKKDFELIAASLAAVRASYGKNWDANLFRACDDMANEFARRIALGHARFDRERFLRAAGVPSHD